MPRHNCPGCRCDIDAYGLVREFTAGEWHVDIQRRPNGSGLDVTLYRLKKADPDDRYHPYGTWEKVSSEYYHSSIGYECEGCWDRYVARAIELSKKPD